MSSSQPVIAQTHTVQTNGHNTASKLKLSPKKPTHVANEQFLSLGDIQLSFYCNQQIKQPLKLQTTFCCLVTSQIITLYMFFCLLWFYLG